ncbi:MAG TPA: hypothetical protein VF960_14620 [Chloroflexota bacterium]
MESVRTASASSVSRERQIEDLKTGIRRLAEERDLAGLADIAEASLLRLRQLIERPATCGDLDDMLETLSRLELDDWETSEE